jgi:hypothetical protein
MHPDSSSTLALVTDDSKSAMLQKCVKNARQPITFSKKFNSAQQKYSACHGQILAIFLPLPFPLGATAQGELWPPEKSSSIRIT